MDYELLLRILALSACGGALFALVAIQIGSES